MLADYEKCLALGRLAVQKVPDYPLGRRNIASALRQLGRIEEGQQALARFLELAPGYSAEAAHSSAPFRYDAEFERYMSGLRKLGWSG